MAWTITETHQIKKMISQAGDEVLEVKLACTSDGSASDYDLTDAEVLSFINGSFFYLLKIVPGTGGDAPSGTFDLDIEDENDNHILDTDSNPVAPTGGCTYHPGSNTMGVYPPIMSSTISLVCATLGDGNTADIYLYFTK